MGNTGGLTNQECINKYMLVCMWQGTIAVLAPGQTSIVRLIIIADEASGLKSGACIIYQLIKDTKAFKENPFPCQYNLLNLGQSVCIR